MERDRERTTILNQMGIRVIRFGNAEVTHNIGSVLASIRAACEE
ncbi:MAG: DUF559 domain-containing protein [Spirochaetes bacterium]|nr:DUF559 domain-containing protein [Spirochaetota bacterium]